MTNDAAADTRDAAPQFVALRPARPDDLAFCRRITHETMRWIIERLFGWDEAEQVAKFAEQWRLDEARVITYAGADAGWLLTKPDGDAIFLGQLHLDIAFRAAESAPR